MKFDNNKKYMIIHYLLEKIQQNSPSISKVVADNFGVNQNTVHVYIKELLEQNIIKRVQRGKYELITKEYEYNLKRSEGALDSDTYAFHACLESHIKDYAENIRQIWTYTFSEMVNNVMDHSCAKNLKIIVEQDYLDTTVLIKDDGVGIFEKIKTYFNLPSVDEAICELFKGKLTTDSVNHSGEGIFFSSKMMDNFFILSSGRIFTNNKYDNSRIINMAAETFEGTCVVMTLSNFSHKQSYEVFDLYSNQEGSFVKTRIPLKNIFDAAPVSRSQAKRVCNRLERFKEVILDFDGLDWMGQGFAHQLFVVFKQEHPNIEFMPINMNEPVTKMYQHVTSES